MVPSGEELAWWAGTAIQLLLLVLTRLKYCSEVAIFFLLYSRLMLLRADGEGIAETKADVLNVPRFLRSNNGAKVSKTGTNGSSFEREEMQESNANWLPEGGR
jgi:hypothetical protein